MPVSVLKTATRILRHRGLHRESHGAIDWNTLLHLLCRYLFESPRWTNQMWIEHLRIGSNKKIFQYCLNSDGSIHYIRAIQGHSGVNKVDPSVLDNVTIPYMLSECIYHIGSSLCLHSIRKRYQRRKTNGILHSREAYD